jgi:hypothetical protein
MRKLFTGIIVTALLALMFALCVASMSQKGATIDEVAHLPAGYSYLVTQDYRMNPEHPPLMKLLAGIPLLLLQPELDEESDAWVYKNEWTFGDEFMFKYNDADTLLFWGRIPIVLVALLLGFYIFKWASELYGTKAGIFALFLFVLCPNILAHSQVVTTDLGVTAFIFISVYYLWRYTKEQSSSNLVLMAISFGLALASKFTAVYLIPIFAVMIALTLYAKRNGKSIKEIMTSQDTKNFLVPFVYVVLVAIIVIAVTYFFVNFQDYFTGLKDVILHSAKGHNTFLMGEHSTQGWWYYFIVAFFVKTPLPTIILLALSILLFKKIRHKEMLNEAFIVLPAVIYFIPFMFSHLNIGLRHILPVYPFIFLFVSKLANYRLEIGLGKEKKTEIFKFAVLALCIWYAAESFMIYPHYLAYFNQIAGGPDNGYNFLIDSNIDWGQDLKGLKLWMDDNHVENISIRYIGNDNLEYRNISYTPMKCYPTPGIAAASVNVVHGLLSDDRTCKAWLRDFAPIAKIGYSIFVYNITEDQVPQIEDEKEYACMTSCKYTCKEQGLEYLNSSYTNKCSCQCKKPV